MADERVRVLVSGDVQGVFFRTTIQDVAERLGVTGWVRNRADGRVEAEFQGSRNAVAHAVRFCRHGPRSAEVYDVSVEQLEPLTDERGFEVR